MNIEKLNRMEELTFSNGLRLHRDSIILFKNSSFASANQLSVLSLEEFGKVSLIESYIGEIVMYGDSKLVDHTKFVHSLYNHPSKQKIFASDLLFAFPKRFIDSITKNTLELIKQKSTYVGFQNRKNINSRLTTPETIGSEVARKQITIVNDYLIVLTYSVLKNIYHWDTLNINRLFTDEFLSELKRNWRFRGRKMKSSIKFIDRLAQ